MDPSSSPAAAVSFPFTSVADNSGLSQATANAIETHLMELSATRSPATTDRQGTVLAIVTFPKDDSLRMACDGKRWCQDIQLRMSYDKLISLESKKIDDMFTPRAQARFRRRHGFERELPRGIKFILDFTPPAEGAELAELTAALWLPQMVKIWFLAGQYFPNPIIEQAIGHPSRPLADKAVGAILTLGHDDVCKNLACLTDYTEWQGKDWIPGIVDDLGPGPSHIPAWRRVEDYCPIRHRVAIVRVLRAINGDGLLLNSAVRLWTVAQVAIALEVPQVVVDPVTQWLVAPPNTKFIEICPEIAFRLAYALKIPSVLTTAFKILVNELAVDYASSDPVTSKPPMTWAQRRRDEYGDYPSDPVEYASRAFAERMGETLKMLQSDDVFNNLPSPILEWEKLQAYGATITAMFAPSHPLLTAYSNLTAALLATFHGWVDNALNLDTLNTSHRLSDDLLEAQRKHYVPSIIRKPLVGLYWTLNPTQKLLTPFFWNQLIWIQPYDQIIKTHHHGTPLVDHAEKFNLELQRALTEAVAPTIAYPYDPATMDPIEHRRAFIDSTSDLNGPAATNPLVATALAQTPARQLIPELVAFNPARFFHELSRETRALGGRHLPNHSVWMRDNESATSIPLFLSDHHLLSLDDRELGYLPIWADGLDDGTGGVFQDHVPSTDMGPSEPGPAYHTGHTTAGTATVGTTTDAAPASTIAPSDLGVANLALSSHHTNTNTTTTNRTDDWVMSSSTPTAGRSLAAHRSGTATSGTMEGERSTRGATPTPSEAFTMGGEDEDGLYADARYAQPAGHQGQGLAIERYVDEVDGEGEGEGGGGGGDGFEWDSDGMELDLDEGSEDEDGDEDDGSSTLDGFEDVDVDGDGDGDVEVEDAR
ncbi:hypothetical protein CHGG_04731 [Chaetomium globosum CBS 148.51]|uniref:Uncharacterized protein n=1 Tax=Chaetomium globosum (strain ATCC 6205 / CBS 148.51 / DSM 1962 / NBRC 6347 / NRRL 1970) TaxID=306901 RepID=Q2H0G5_CHAGB|nr:uncharacterized protein CHGG_04731 [Chaetomium globosum CBS 148.51]EAQ88112.1 hypothetical protein CHGG_04731 [Chaetomium globosum CBS 148.51]